MLEKGHQNNSYQGTKRNDNLFVPKIQSSLQIPINKTC